MPLEPRAQALLLRGPVALISCQLEPLLAESLEEGGQVCCELHHDVQV